MVEPYTFLIVESRARLTAFRDVKQFCQFVNRVHLPLSARVPSQESQEVDYRLGEISAFAVSRRHLARLRVVPFEREYGESQSVAVALAQFTLAFRLEQQWQMGKSRHGVLPSESLVKQYVQWCARQPLLAAYHMGDLHQMVIHYVCKMICRQLVGALV